MLGYKIEVRHSTASHLLGKHITSSVQPQASNADHSVHITSSPPPSAVPVKRAEDTGSASGRGKLISVNQIKR